MPSNPSFPSLSLPLRSVWLLLLCPSIHDIISTHSDAHARKYAHMQTLPQCKSKDAPYTYRSITITGKVLCLHLIIHCGGYRNTCCCITLRFRNINCKPVHTKCVFVVVLHSYPLTHRHTPHDLLTDACREMK